MAGESAQPEERAQEEQAPRARLPRMPSRSAREWSRDSVLALVLGAVIVAGFGLDYVGGSPPERPTATAGGFVARARFCPPAPKGGSSQATVVAAAAAGSAGFAIEPGRKRKADVDSVSISVVTVPTPMPVDAVGYDGPITAAAALRFNTPVAGAGAAICAPSAAHRWYLPEGSTQLGFDERILVYNPFPDEAVVAVTLFTSDGRRAKANLADVAVPARSAIGLAVNDYIRAQGVVGAAVVTRRGRVVVWRALFAKPEGLSSGGQLSLASPVPAPNWFFPDGGVGPGLEERISVLNPSREEAVLRISLVAGNEVIQPPKLVEVTVAPGTTRAFWLPNLVGGTDSRVGGAGAIVRSINGVEVVAERTVWYDTADESGVASEVGATGSARSWWLPPATLTPSTDSVVVLNPTSERAVVSLQLFRRNGRPLAPRLFREIVVPGYGRVRIPIARLTSGSPMAALISSGNGPVVAERTSYSSRAGDVASVIGIPLDRFTAR